MAKTPATPVAPEDWRLNSMLSGILREICDSPLRGVSLRTRILPWATKLGFVAPDDFRQEPDAIRSWFSGFDKNRKNAALQDLVGTLIAGEGFVEKAASRVLRRHKLTFAHGSFVPHGKIVRQFQTVFDSYTMLDKVGQGGNGVVSKVKNEAGEILAMKVLPGTDHGSTRRKRFANELWFCAQEHHVNIIRVLDWGLSSVRGEPFYVMPLYDGSLRDLVKKKLSPERALHVFQQALDGVEAAHQKNVWHRDLKPENFLYETKKDRLLLADFGIAHFQEDTLPRLNAMTRKGDRLANRDYAAPEQRRKGDKVDGRADVYALGIILNELFTGEMPLGTGHKTISQAARGYGYLDKLVKAMMQSTPAKRPDVPSVRAALARM